MSNSTTHFLPYPIANARYSLPLSFRVSAGTPTDPTTPDTEFSSDGGATFADCAEEITTGGANGMGYLTLTGAETNNRMLLIAGKSANCVTTPAILHPRNLAIVGSGTLSAGSSGGGTLGTLLAYDVTGCFIRTTGGTGGGGTGGANNQARRILTYNTSTGAFTVSTWETAPDATTTYDILLPEGVTLGMLKTLNPTTAGSTLTVTGNKVFLADGAHGGTSATITLERIIGASTTSNEPCVKLTGNGTAAGLSSTGGADGASGILATGGAAGGATNGGPGIKGIGGAAGGNSGGHGLFATGGGTGGIGGYFLGGGSSAVGMRMESAGANTGLVIVGGADGMTITASAGDGVSIASSGTTKHCIKLLAHATNGDGINIATDAGHGITIAATGASKHGVTITGGSSGTSDALKLTAGSGGVGVRLDTLTASGNVTISGTTALQALTLTTLTASGAVALQSTLGITGATTLTGNVVLSDGLTISAPSTSNRAGLSITGNGSGAGVSVAGGGTGSGIVVTTTSADAVTLTATGTSKHGLVITGGNGGTSDGLKLVAGTGGVGARVATLTVTGATTLTGAVALSNGLSINGFTSLGSLLVTAADLGDVAMTTLAISGATTLHALTLTTLTASGAVALQSTLAITGNLTAANLTNARIGYLDNLNVGGAVASSAEITALNQSASRRVVLVTVPQYERPESSTSTYTVELRTYDGDGAATNADSTPTITPTGIVSGDLSANLGAVSNPATGVYRATYSVTSGATAEQIRFDASATIASSTFTITAYTQVVDAVSQTWTSTDATHLTAIFNKLPSNNIADETLVLAAIGTPAQAATALSTAQWTNALATNLGTLAGHDPGTTLGTSTLTQTQVTGGAYSVQSASCVLGDSRIANLNATVSSRMATYTQPTGFLAATFPATVASPTNITAATGVVLAASGLDLVVPADPGTTKPVLGTSSIVAFMGYFGAWSLNEVESDGSHVRLRNTADDANLATHATSDDGTTFESGPAT